MKIYAQGAKSISSDTLVIGPWKPVEPDFGIPVNDTIPPRVEVLWGQDFPEGYFCPNKKSGCVQTATAMAMAYLEYPNSIPLTYNKRDKETEFLNWKRLKLHKRSIFDEDESCVCTLSKEEHFAIGRLCRQIAEINLAEFIVADKPEDNATSVNGNKHMLAINKYLSYKVKYTHDNGIGGLSLYEELFAGNRIALLGGAEKIAKNKYEGHVWLCDGGRRRGIYNVKGKLINGESAYYVGDIYLHYNWGWCGRSNGYFSSNIFDSNRAYEYDGYGKSYPGGDFSLKQWCVVFEK